MALDPRRILVLGYACFVLYGFPGYMSTDSVAQIVEARTLELSDAHPPLMAAEWALLDRLVSGPLLMLLLQGALFLGGLYVLLQRWLAPRVAAWTAVAILLYPPVLTTMAVIWKDSQMAAYLVAGVAALLQPRLRTRILGLGLLAAACALRHNAFAAVVPLVFFLFEWRAGITWWKRIAVLVGVVAITLGATFALSRLLTSQHVRLTPVFQDIVGVIAVSDDMSDEQLRELLRDTPLDVPRDIQARARTLHAQGGAFRITEGTERFFDYPKTQEQWDALYRAWRDLVLGDPLAYLESKWLPMHDLLGLDGVPLRAPVWNLFLEEPITAKAIEHNASWSWLQMWTGRMFYWLSDETPLFRPYVYALVALLLLALCCRDRVTAGLLVSGLLYELSFLPVSANPDYRYSHWMITSTVIASVILFVQRWRMRPA